MIGKRDFHDMVLRRRRQLRMTQEELANMSGISRNYLSQIENGKANNLSNNIVVRLSRILALDTFDRPERTFTASCYLCQTDASLQMIPHRKDGCLVGWIFSCAECAPKLYGAELIATLPQDPNPNGISIAGGQDANRLRKA